MKIAGHAAIVTGAGSGMGAASARTLAAAGARVTLLDLNGAGAEAVAAECGGLALTCDVGDAASAEQAVVAAREAHGAARILVNCAGIAPAQRVVSRDGNAMPLGDFEQVIRVNLVGTFNLLRLVAAGLREAEPLDAHGERGVIVNTASVAAYEGQIGQSAYSASKGGVVALTLQAVREFASMGVRVMTIAPGLIGTPMLLEMPADVQASLAATVPFPRRFGEAEEFASLVRHICENQMLNGEVIRLDGALRMQPR